MEIFDLLLGAFILFQLYLFVLIYLHLSAFDELNTIRELLDARLPTLRQSQRAAMTAPPAAQLTSPQPVQPPDYYAHMIANLESNYETTD